MAGVRQGPKEIELNPEGPGRQGQLQPRGRRPARPRPRDRPDHRPPLHLRRQAPPDQGDRRSPPTKVTMGEAYAAFLSILQQNGMTVMPHGRFLKIVESQGGLLATTPIYGTANPVPAEDRYVTRLYRLQNIVDAGEVATPPRTSSSRRTRLHRPRTRLRQPHHHHGHRHSEYQPLLRIVEEIDVGGAGDQLWVEPIHYAAAEDVANKLNEILDLKGGAGSEKAAERAAARRSSPTIAPTPSIITATKPDYDKILELIKRMVDAPVTGEVPDPRAAAAARGVRRPVDDAQPDPRRQRRRGTRGRRKRAAGEQRPRGSGRRGRHQRGDLRGRGAGRAATRRPTRSSPPRRSATTRSSAP
jgi:hypothetical protein